MQTIKLSAAVLVSTAVSFASATTYHLQIFAPRQEGIHGEILSAAGLAFYTNVTASTYCPDVVGYGCPEPAGTLVYDGLGGMAVMVPGGQEIYVSADGAVRYTQAHSTYRPPGSFTGCFHNRTVELQWGCKTTLHEVATFAMPDKPEVGGLLVCPDVPNHMDAAGATYQLYARTPNFNKTGCAGILGLVEVWSEVEFGAWQYS